MVGWELGDVEKLLTRLFEDDVTIQQKMGISGANKARVANSRVPRDKTWLRSVYIFFYCVPGPDSRVQGNRRIMANPDYDIEVRTFRAPTDDSEAIIERIDELMGMSRTLTANGKWIVSAIPMNPINITQEGATPEEYTVRRGRTYRLQVVQS